MNAKLLLVLACLAGCVTGCSSIPRKLEQFEKLGVKHAEITGKWSHTVYTVETDGGIRRATLDHSNAWTPKVHIVRETPVEQEGAR